MSAPLPGLSAEYKHSKSEMDIQKDSCLCKPKGFSQKIVQRGQSPKQPDRACGKWADEMERRKRVPKAPKPHEGGKVRKQVTFLRVRPAVSEPSSRAQKSRDVTRTERQDLLS